MGDVRYPVVELRQYALHPGRREDLIALFDREFVETQEACGMAVVGQFRDLDRPDHFVWLRGFPDMDSRARSLAEFYGGPVWNEHRDAANATMIDSDDVLLLRPLSPAHGFPEPAGRDGPAESALLVAVNPSTVDGEFLFETEPAENTFPALPVRTGEPVTVSFRRYPTVAAMTEAAAHVQAAELLRLTPTERSALR
ncbi:NIPSNAP family containing protein [Virgisporangium aliadipatigenens]|uniref:NIPSNAP family containing protein n=1 Tax=Virgisporangium aliadipatigenens TaxID=741659 RepID=A0A8J3YE09_9ACTN|nr:NIPSNAP family protein [Virgisporangium aliadipatigenens]GIJ43261.1 NIPSNAP family containing protein [Virgisporangium aliadipatigenens]